MINRKCLPQTFLLLIILFAGVCVSIFVPQESSSNRLRKKNDVSETLDWVDAQDLYDYNARDGSLWSDLLEQWSVRNGSAKTSSSSSAREGRVFRANQRYIPTSGFFITKRMGEAAELEPHMRPPGGKVISQFRPSPPYGLPQPMQAQPQAMGAPGQREISETDLYLLGAIEKLVFRVDYLEQRLRKTEQLVYYLMQGNNPKDESFCPQNFTQVDKKCYHFGANREVNWQSANNLCKAMGAHLAEFEEKIELKQMTKYLLGESSPEKGKEFWLGGLNPGLLWIWSNSARPINANTNLTLAAAQGKSGETVTERVDSVEKKAKESVEDEGEGESEARAVDTSAPTYDEIKGSGRCLKLSYNSKKGRYQYQGHDCSSRQYYMCEFEDNPVENEINRVAKELLSKDSKDIP